MATTKGELNMGDIQNLDRQIEILMECKPLSETEVKLLCEKVSSIFIITSSHLNIL
jgi:hypothetical protein